MLNVQWNAGPAYVWRLSRWSCFVMGDQLRARDILLFADHLLTYSNTAVEGIRLHGSIHSSKRYQVAN